MGEEMRNIIGVLLAAATPCLPVISHAQLDSQANRAVTASSRVFSPAVFTRLAVLVEDRTHRFGRESGVLHQVEDEVIRGAIAKGYTLADRSDMSRVFSEGALSDRGITEYAMATKARALSVSAILVVSVNEFAAEEIRQDRGARRSGPDLYLTHVAIGARLINAELAQIVWLATLATDSVVDTRESEEDAVPATARIIAEAIPDRKIPSEGTNSFEFRGTSARVTTSPEFATANLGRFAIYVEDRTHRMSSSDGSIRRIEDVFILNALQRGYLIAARSDLDKIRREIAFQANETADDVLARAGRALGVPAVILVSVDKLTESADRASGYDYNRAQYGISVSARMVTTQKAQVVWLSSFAQTYSGHRMEEQDFLSDAASVTAEGLPFRPQ